MRIPAVGAAPIPPIIDATASVRRALVVALYISRWPRKPGTMFPDEA